MKVKGIAVSNQLAHMLSEKYNVRKTVVENGIDLSTFYPDPDDDLIRSKGNRSAVLVLSRKDHAKGLDIAIKVINKISAEWKDRIEIWISGEELDEEILPVKVRNFGWVTQERLRKLLSSADLLFYPTRQEGLPLMPLEAMACGCPVVTTRAVSYVTDGDNALVTEIEDTDNLRNKLETILTDGPLTGKLQKSGFKTASKYDLKNSRECFEKAIGNVLGLNSNPSTMIPKKASYH